MLKTPSQMYLSHPLNILFSILLFSLPFALFVFLKKVFDFVFVKDLVYKMNFHSQTIHPLLCLESHVKEVTSYPNSCLKTNCPRRKKMMTAITCVFNKSFFMNTHLFFDSDSFN